MPFLVYILAEHDKSGHSQGRRLTCCESGSKETQAMVQAESDVVLEQGLDGLECQLTSWVMSPP